MLVVGFLAFESLRTETVAEPTRAQPLAPSESIASPAVNEAPAVGALGDRSPATLASNGGAVSPTARQTASITGVVLEDVSGVPIADADVRAFFRLHGEFDVLDLDAMRSREEVAATSSASDGSFTLVVPEDVALELVVRAPTFATHRGHHVFAGERVEVRLPIGAVFEGCVTRATTGAPVPGVPVLGWSREATLELFRVEADAGGNFRVDDLAPGVFRLELLPSGLKPPPHETIDLGPGEHVRRDYALEEGYTVVGTVTDATSGAPIAGAEVAESWIFRRGVRTDATGRYELAGLRWSELHARAPGYAFGLHEFKAGTAGEPTTVDFALEPGQSVIGVVVDERGMPLERVYAAAVALAYVDGMPRVDWEATRTDTAGRFRIDSLNPLLDHQLLLRRAGRGTRVVEFPADESPQPLDLGTLALGPPATLRGTVLQTGGAALPHVEVTLRGHDDGIGRFLVEGVGPTPNSYTANRTSRTDGAGGFHFADLAPGTYEVRVDVPGTRRTESIEVALTEGQTLDNVALEIEPGSSIRGRILSPNGIGLADVQINALTIDGTRANIASTSSTSNGAFELTGIDTDEVELRCYPWRYNTDREVDRLAANLPVRVAVGATDLIVYLRREVLLRGRVLNRGGAPEPFLYVAAYPPDSTRSIAVDYADEEGRFELALPEGERISIVTGEKRVFEAPERIELTGYDDVRIHDVPSDAQDVLVVVGP